MAHTVIWSLPAQLELRDIVEYIGLDSEAAARKVHAEIHRVVSGLARLPFAGAIYEKDRTGRVRETLCGKYRIFYEVDERSETVEILTIWHGSRREPKF